MLKLVLSFLFVSFFCYTSGQAQEVFPDNVKTNFEKAVYYNTIAESRSIVDSQLIYTKKALLFAKKSNNDSLLFATYYFQSYYGYYTSKYKKALQQALELDSLLVIKRNEFYSVKNKILLGQILIIIDKPLKALEFGNQALDISLIMNDSLLIADSYYNLGFLYSTNQMNKQAKKYYSKSLEIYELINADSKTKYGVSTGLVRVSETYDETLYYLDKTFELLKNEKNINKVAYFYVNKGDVLIHFEQGLKESIKASKIGLKLSDSIHNKELVKVALLNISRGNIDLKNYAAAIKPLNKILEMDKGNTQTHFLVLQALTKAHAGLKEFEKSYEYGIEMTALKDSIYTIKESNSFAEFDAKFKTAEKDKEIAQQQLEISKQKSTRNKWIYGSLALLLVGFSIFQWRNNMQKREKLLAETNYKNEQEINELRTKFLGNIAHEIRTPLTLITGNLDLALENYDHKEKAVQNIKTALSNSKKVVEDANGILELLKFEKSKTTIKLSTIPINQTLKRIFLSFSSLAEMKHVNLNFQSNIPEATFTKIDIGKVEKILNNLVSNAIKYSPSKSQIIFEANLVESILLTVKVTDFGQGIHFNETEKIFERFYQSSESTAVGGIGIGLSLAKEFAEFLNGSLIVESELGKGSTFIFKLPMETSVIARNEELEPKQSLDDATNELERLVSIEDSYIDNVKHTKKTPETGQHLVPIVIGTPRKDKPKILIVEDNPEMASYLEEILSENYVCDKAFDGIEALEKIKSSTYDLITSDIMMPKLDGFQLREKLNEDKDLKNIPFILISAKTLEEDKIKGFNLGIDDYIVKPFNKNELVARINNLLDNKFSREKWVLQNPEELEEIDSSQKQLLDKIRTTVEKNISDEGFKIAELASSVGYSQRQLTRILKKYTGMSPVKFILEIRLQRAYFLLQNKAHFTLSEVRFDVGITSSSYFNKKFKERFGVNPSDLLR